MVFLLKNNGVNLKILLITFLLLTEISFANYISSSYNWNKDHKTIPKERRAHIPDLISLFAIDDVYVYHDTDIFGYSKKATVIKDFKPVNLDN